MTLDLCIPLKLPVPANIYWIYPHTRLSNLNRRMEQATTTSTEDDYTLLNTFLVLLLVLCSCLRQKVNRWLPLSPQPSRQPLLRFSVIINVRPHNKSFSLCAPANFITVINSRRSFIGASKHLLPTKATIANDFFITAGWLGPTQVVVVAHVLVVACPQSQPFITHSVLEHQLTTMDIKQPFLPHSAMLYWPSNDIPKRPN